MSGLLHRTRFADCLSAALCHKEQGTAIAQSLDALARPFFPGRSMAKGS